MGRLERFKNCRRRFYREFDGMNIPDDVVTAMCMGSLDEVEELLSQYDQILDKLNSLIGFYLEIKNEED